MRKRLVLALAVGLVALVTSAAIVSASQSSTPITKRQVIRVKEVTKQFHVVADHGAPGPTAGDEIAVTTVFLKNGKIVGRNAITCAFTSNTVAYCDGVSKMHGGQLTFQARVPKAALSHRGASFRLAITGGTGIYQNVSGYGVVTTLSPRASRDTLHINP
jgi:hypothetical protein